MSSRVRVDSPVLAQGPHAVGGGAARADGGRVPELDALRGLAAVAVVVYHSSPKRLPWGWSAVDFFFVLSGYLITAIILRHGGTPGFLPRFYARRGLRTWPIYYLTLLVLVALSPVLPKPCDFSGLPYELTYTQNVPFYWSNVAPRFCKYLGHTWTLAVEEQFYLIWPALVLTVGRRVAWLASALAVGSFLARAYGMPVSLLAGRADGLALGGLLAWLLHREAGDGGVGRGHERAFGAVAAACAAVLVALAVGVGMGPRNGYPPWKGLTVLAFNGLWFGVVGLAVCGTGRPALAFLRRPRLRRLGEISYGLYLYHFVIIVLTGDVAKRFGLRGQPFWREGPTLAACFLAAWLSWRWVEQPILGLKDRFAYGPGDRDALKPSEPAGRS